MLNKIILVTSVFLFIVASLMAHSGRTDKYGGHNNRKTGGYHYHNTGSLHAPSNSFQNHTTCGICSTSKKKESKNTGDISEKEFILTLQAGLKCLGYEVEADGKLGKETKEAIKLYLISKKSE